MSLLLALACLSEPTPTIAAQNTPSPDLINKSELRSVDPSPRTVSGLLSNLADDATSQRALEDLVTIGDPAVPALGKEAIHGKDITARGWAVQALARIDSKAAEQEIVTVYERTHPGATEANALVHVWAAAAQSQQADDADELLALSQLRWQHPSLQRPFQARMATMASEITNLRGALELVNSDPTLAPALAGVLEKAQVSELAELMFNDANDGIRRTAAGLLASRSDEARTIARLYAFNPGAEKVPWAGGALYVPSLGWQKNDAQILVGNLVAWYVYCEDQGLSTEKQQIYNNLNSLGLVNTVGMDWPSFDGHELLVQYGNATSRGSARRILAEQGLLEDEDWAPLLERIR